MPAGTSIGIIGGGINGVAIAWLVAKQGYAVTLYERGPLMSQTSSASTKLLHGGLRYLEHGQFSLVRESLHERQWWLDNCPDLAKPLPIILPVYEPAKRGRAIIKLGLCMYD